MRGLRASFTLDGRVAQAVDGVSFEIARGEVLALVGESGCGKTATALALLGLLPVPPARIDGGEAFFRGRDLLRMSPRELRRVRGKEIAMAFQDPMTALNPVFTVGSQVAEAVRAHERVSRRAARDRAVALLERVGIASARERAGSYPHQLSGGMKQRVLIAMALACGPELIIADEPTTALDVTVQAQIIELLRRLGKESGLSILLITHDMGLVAELADRVAVMYAGRIVEEGPVAAIFDRPLHPYTRGLFESLPRLHVPRESLRAIPGDVPDPADFPSGCRFRPRCPLALEACADSLPPLAPVGPDRLSACIRVEDGALPEAGPAPLARNSAPSSRPAGAGAGGDS